VVSSSYTGRSYAEADKYLGPRAYRRIANNTVLIRYPDGIAVRWHKTVAVWYPVCGPVRTYSGPDPAPTLLSRIAQFSPKEPNHVVA